MAAADGRYRQTRRLIEYADAANDPLPRTMQWLDQPAWARRGQCRWSEARTEASQDTTSRIFG